MLDWIDADLDAGPDFELTHQLGPSLQHLASVSRRAELMVDPVFRANAAEIERVLSGFAWNLSLASEVPPQRELKAVAWNIERGKRFHGVAEALARHPQLAGADLILLNEVDVGMGRSGNLDVPRALAQQLGLNYVYCNYELLLSLGDAFERDHGTPNTLGLHGAALLTRLPVTRAGAIGLPEFSDKFHADEKRLGGKRALFCEVGTAAGPLTVVLPHLDPFAPPTHRGAQMRRIARFVDRWDNARVLLGGDLNTNTYDFGTRLGLARNVSYKLLRLGFDETIRQYMTPEQVFERRTFEALREAGLQIDGFNDRNEGSTFFDIHDPELRDWTERYIPRPARAWLERRLRPWNGTVPLRIDWFAGRRVAPLQSGVVDRPLDADGRPLSDHNPLFVTFEPS